MIHLKSYFRYQDIEIFILTCLIIVENSWIRKLRLVLKFMTSKIGEKIFTINILLNISRIKGKQTMTFAQLKEYNLRYIFHEKSLKMR